MNEMQAKMVYRQVRHEVRFWQREVRIERESGGPESLSASVNLNFTANLQANLERYRCQPQRFQRVMTHYCLPPLALMQEPAPF